MLNAGDIVVVVQAVNICRRMPGRPACQLVTFQQDTVCPAKFGKVIEDGTSGKSATNDNDLSIGLHRFVSTSTTRFPDPQHSTGQD